MHPLETPGTTESPDWGSLYLYRGDEVNANRPVFTGDVFAIGGADRMVIVMQHPCAIRLDGVNLVEKLLVCEVSTSNKVSVGGWSGNYKQLPLPELVSEGGDHYSAFFHRPDLLPSVDLPRGARIACLSAVGVALLLQRWLHHNSRVIVPSWDIHPAIVEQLEEADLIEEWCDEREAIGIDAAEAEAHFWLRSDSGNGSSWQSLLENPQTRSRVRSAMRSELRTRKSH